MQVEEFQQVILVKIKTGSSDVPQSYVLCFMTSFRFSLVFRIMITLHTYYLPEFMSLAFTSRPINTVLFMLLMFIFQAEVGCFCRHCDRPTSPINHLYFATSERREDHACRRERFFSYKDIYLVANESFISAPEVIFNDGSRLVFSVVSYEHCLANYKMLSAEIYEYLKGFNCQPGARLEMAQK